MESATCTLEFSSQTNQDQFSFSDDVSHGMGEIGFTQHNPTTIYIDATAALDQTTSMNIPRDQKFMAQRRGWVVAQFADGLARGVHCQTNYMMADANTKAHTVQRQIENARNLQGHGTIEVFSSVARHASKN